MNCVIRLYAAIINMVVITPCYGYNYTCVTLSTMLVDIRPWIEVKYEKKACLHVVSCLCYSYCFKSVPSSIDY